MKTSTQQSICAASIYFIILLSLALWVRDIPNQHDALRSTANDIIKTSPLGDPTYFATAAIDVAKNGWITSDTAWVFNLWPPGFVLLQAAIIKAFGADVPIILVLQILASALFAAVMTQLFGFLRDLINLKVAFALPLLILAFPVSRVFLLQPVGISLGETFSIGFFLMATLLSLRSVECAGLRYSVAAGICFALSAYFRSQFEVILLALTVCGILILACLLVDRRHLINDPSFKKAAIKTIFVTLLTAHAATMPWRVYHLIHQGSPQWVFTSRYMMENSVMSSETLISNGGGFIVAGGGNMACLIDPTTCGDTKNATKLFWRTLLNHPVEWYSRKCGLLPSYWFSSVKNWSTVGMGPSRIDIVTNSLLLIALIISILFACFQRRRGGIFWILLVWLCSALLLAYFMIITIAQLEVRYFYFPKIFGILMFVIVASLFFRRKKEPPHALSEASAVCFRPKDNGQV